MVDFSEYMNIPVGTMKRVTLPKGHYFARLDKHEPKESTQGKPMYIFQFVIDSAGDDVDVTALGDFQVAGKKLTRNCMLDTDFGRDDIRQTLEALLGPGVMDPTQGWGQYLEQVQGKPVKLYIDHRPRNKDTPEDGEVTEDIKKVLPAV